MSLLLEPIEPATTGGRGAPGFEGLLRFIHYGFMPNHLGYCGGDDNLELLERAGAGSADHGLEPLLRKFTGALPYLKLIARANGITDPFDERVVEAYWIGSDLLLGVEVRQLYDDLLDRFGRQLPANVLKWVAGKAPAGAKPHHNFHVFDVHSRAGEQGMSIETMDACRISWGTVLSNLGADVLVERQPLELNQGALRLGPASMAVAHRQIDGRGYLQPLPVGSSVSLHWGWACEPLAPAQLANLRRWTEHHLILASQTL